MSRADPFQVLLGEIVERLQRLELVQVVDAYHDGKGNRIKHNVEPRTRTSYRCAWLERRFALHVSQSDDGRWHAGLETDEQFNHPEPNIVALVMAIEALDPHFRALWSACTSREFNIGYECGDAPWAFNHELTAATLARVAALGVSLRITLYPPDTATSEPSESTPDTTA